MMDEWNFPSKWDEPEIGDVDTPPVSDDPEIDYARDVVITSFALDDGSEDPGYVAPGEWGGNVPTPDAQILGDVEQASEGDSLPVDPLAPEEDIFEEVE